MTWPILWSRLGTPLGPWMAHGSPRQHYPCPICRRHLRAGARSTSFLLLKLQCVLRMKTLQYYTCVFLMFFLHHVIWMFIPPNIARLVLIHPHMCFFYVFFFCIMWFRFIQSQHMWYVKRGLKNEILFCDTTVEFCCHTIPYHRCLPRTS